MQARHVTFSCVKTLEGLFIKNLKPVNIKVYADVVTEMERLSTLTLPNEPVPKVLSLPGDNWISFPHKCALILGKA